MSYFIKNAFSSRDLGKQHLGVKVKVKGNTLILEGMVMVKSDTKITPLPEKYKVVDSEGNQVPASGKFYVTTESIDPYHILIDLLD